MDLLLCLTIFIIFMTLSLIFNVPILLPLLIGYAGFIAVGVHRKEKLISLTKNSLLGVKESWPAIKIFILVGIITAVWRTSGTIAFFLYYGIQTLHPYSFVFMCFILCCILSCALGTVFGVVGTLGVVLMIICRSGNMNEAVIAGAIMSGAYLGDRCSPFSSCSNLIALTTKVPIYEHIRQMIKTSILPVIICGIIYMVLSLKNPIVIHNNEEILTALQEEFNLSPVTVIPVLLIILMPLCRIKLDIAMLSSIASAIIVTLLFQPDISFIHMLGSCFGGYHISTTSIGEIFSGGGVISMATPCYIAAISNAYPAIFKGTNALDFLYGFIEKSIHKTGKYATTAVLGTAISSIFCNQSLALMMGGNMLSPAYEKVGAKRRELAADIGNSTAMFAGMIPWCIACSVPLSILGAGAEALPFSFLLYLSPVCYAFTKKLFR